MDGFTTETGRHIGDGGTMNDVWRLLDDLRKQIEIRDKIIEAKLKEEEFNQLPHFNGEIDLDNKFLDMYIVPNYYVEGDFEQMEDWNEDKVNKFKKFMYKQMGMDDAIRDVVDMYIEMFDADFVAQKV